MVTLSFRRYYPALKR